MIQLTPYLNFEGNCREAMLYYQQCLGGELRLQPVAESPMSAQMPAETGNQILHAVLEKEGKILLLASDMLENKRIGGNSITLSIYFQQLDETQVAFEKLSQNGVVTQPLHQTFWGATLGMLTDKFGNHWIFHFSKHPNS
ncbi:VOC family protein [Runella limosa]|jgi:PhnB protein|uniref:VOC family protein n=1 Tax=Runella limosa TaxID=370978 RepID=UPI0004247CC1|nr:glyoxalase/bleomycin resistance/extradiol dioxygenase family protein [Runella limosa]